MRGKRDYHKILNVPPDASRAEIRKAYKRLAFHFHPDRNTIDGDLFLLIHEAYDALMNQPPSEKWRPQIHPIHLQRKGQRVSHNLIFVKERIRKRKSAANFYLFHTPKITNKRKQCMRCLGYGVIENRFKLAELCPLCRGSGRKKISA
ncbi:MAG: J domain-containing protein [Nitrospinota bacterium]